MKISDLPNKEFKIVVIVKVLAEVRRTVHQQSENFNRDGKYKKVPYRKQR